MSKLIGIDYGDKRIGIAISDERHIIAFPLMTLDTGKTLEETHDKILATLNQHTCTTLIMGLPLLMNGKDSEMSLKVRQLAQLLENKSSITVILWDERLTSKQVEKRLIEREVKRKDRTQHIDQMAAALILQSYLDAKQV